MTNKEQLLIKITANEEMLKELKRKKANLELNIERLEQKIKNQKHQFVNIKVEREIQTSSKTKEDEDQSLADDILKNMD